MVKLLVGWKQISDQYDDRGSLGNGTEKLFSYEKYKFYLMVRLFVVLFFSGAKMAPLEVTTNKWMISGDGTKKLFVT